MGSPLLWFGNFAKFLKPGFILPGSTSGQVTVQAPSAITNYTVTLPTAQGGANTVPTNDGSGNLSWTVPGTSPTSTSVIEQQLEQKAENEHYGVQTSALDNSLTSGFLTPGGSYPIQAILMDTLTSGTKAIVPVWNPVVLNPSDKNTTTTTNWSLDTNSSTLTTSGTTKIGATSVAFTKTNGGTSSRIKYDAGSAILGVNGFTDHWFWVNLSSATNVNNVQVVIDIDGTNLQTFTLTTNYAGSALATGWNLMRVDLSTGGVASGTGWSPSQTFRYYHVGITTANASDVPVVLINAIFFSLVNPANYVQLGLELTLYDGTHRENAVIDVANSSIVGGGVNLVSNAANTYSGGYGQAILTRSTLSIGQGQAIMTGTDQFGNTNAGAILLSQEARLSVALRQALSSATMSTFSEVNSPQSYVAASVTGSTIVVNSTVDQSADLKSGEVAHVFKPIYSDGAIDFIHRGDMTMTSNSTFGSNQITLNGTPPAGTAAGDYVVKKVAAVQISAVAVGANDSFVNATPVASPNGVLLYNNGLPIPNPQNVVAYYGLGFPQPTKNSSGSFPGLTLNGALTNNAPFKMGQFGTTGWSSSNYYSAAGTTASFGAISIGVVSVWFYYSTSGHQSFLCGTTAGANGVYIGTNSSNQAEVIVAGYATPAGSLNVGGWNHLVGMWNNLGTIETYLNGALVNSTSLAAGQNIATVDFTIGYNINLALAAASSDIIAQVLVESGAKWTAAQVSQVYNQGLAVILGVAPMLKYRFSDTGITGQNLSVKTILSRDTTNVVPAVTAMGTIQTG